MPVNEPYCIEMPVRTAKTDSASKCFEKDFASQYRKSGLWLQRILDMGYEPVAADYYSVIGEGEVEGLPAMACFFELISTDNPDLPISEIDPDVLDELARYSLISSHLHAGFLVQFRIRKDKQIIYLSGLEMKQYLDSHPKADHIPVEYLEERGIPMPMYKSKPTARKCLVMGIHQFLLALNEKAAATWAAAA